MSKRASSMAELSKRINNILQKTLNADNNLVAEDIKRTESNKVQEVVYNAYEPYVYERRGDKGGLSSMENMNHEATEANGKVKMSVVNMTPPHPEFNGNNLEAGQVAELVEGGHGYKGLEYEEPSGVYAKPRPFQQATVDELNSSKEHVYSLMDELEAQGIMTKKL